MTQEMFSQADKLRIAGIQKWITTMSRVASEPYSLDDVITQFQDAERLLRRILQKGSKQARPSLAVATFASYAARGEIIRRQGCELPCEEALDIRSFQRKLDDLILWLGADGNSFITFTLE